MPVKDIIYYENHLDNVVINSHNMIKSASLSLINFRPHLF